MIMSDFWDQIAEIADLNKVRRFQGYLIYPTLQFLLFRMGPLP